MKHTTLTLSKKVKRELDLIKVIDEFKTFDELLSYMIKLYEGENK